MVYFRHLNCGFDDNGPKVLCSDNLGGQEDEEHILDYDDEDEEIDEYDELENEEEYDYSLRSGVIDGLSEDGNVCSGSLVCYVLHKDNFSVSKVVRRKRSIRGSVFRVEILGTVVGRPMSANGFGGNWSPIYQDLINTLKSLLSPIQKVDCSQETN
ncbi:Uncharacterized protein FKW44_005138 [Caligus rogercresseyi]|uniref:Uncharacterized protein n=1 Tax=Caligus rogercresseyi TaxID=217165 RepID=A0A7T8KBJ4_CALRO|nr:Uncharacterized protein FKW44_005138 [Caligus rogercresseyi]